VVEKLADTWSAITHACDVDEFAPRTGPLCGWCPYVDRCPEGTKEVAKRQAKRDAEAAALAGFEERMAS